MRQHRQVPEPLSFLNPHCPIREDTPYARLVKVNGNIHFGETIMETLDGITKISTPRASRYDPEPSVAEVADELKAQAEDAIEDVSEAARKIDWWQVAGYVVAGAALVGAAVAYASYRQYEKKPATRIGRLRDQLGLSEVDFRDLRSTYNRVDLDKLNRTGRELGTAARKATHRGAKTVAHWTR